MKRKAGWCLVTCLIGGLAWVAWPREVAVPEGTPLPLARKTTSTASESPSPDVELEETAQAGPVRTELLARESAWVIRGGVRRGSYEPFPHALFRAELYEGYETVGSPVASADIEAGPEGRFAWALDPPSGAVTVKFSGPEELRMLTETRLVVARSPPEDILLYCFPVDAHIQGRVTTQTGEGIPRAHVQTQRDGQDRVDCDEDGSFSIPVSSWSSTVSLRGGAPGHATARQNVVPPRAGETVVVDLQLGPALTIRGRVTDRDSVPVQGAAVATFFTSGYTSVLTDQEGRYVMDYLEPGRPSHSLYARKDGYVEATTQVRTDDLRESYDLVLERGVACEGRVFGPDGQPVPGVRLYIGFSPAAYNRLDAVARDDGRFVFPHLGPGEHDLVTEAPGFAPDLRKLTVPDDSGTPVRIEVTLALGYTISGFVVAESGSPLQDIRISARTPRGPRDLGRYIGESVRADAEGQFTIPDLPEGRVDVEFFGRGFVRYVEEGVETGRRDLRIQMSRSGQLAGRVIDGSTGRSLERFRIRFVSSIGGGFGVTWAREGHEFLGSDGYWDTGNENLALGAPFVVEASAPGYGSAAVELVTEAEPDRQEHVLELFPSERITGRVLAARTGEPIAGARIVLSTELNPVQPGNAEDFYGRVVATSDDEGRFEMLDVPAGEVSLAMQHPDWPFLLDGPFSVMPDVPVERLILAQPLGRLTGIVLDAEGQAIAGARVRAMAQEVTVRPRGELVATTDGQGRFELDRGLEPGTYILSVDAGEDRAPFTVIGGMVEIALGETSDVNLRPAGTCEIVGTIETDGIDLPPSVSIMMVPRPQEGQLPGRLDLGAYYSKSDGDKIHVKGLPPGRYQVWASHQDLFGNADVRVSEGVPAKVIVTVRSRSRIR